MARLKYWLWLSCVGGVRPLAKYRLCEALGGPEAVFYASKDELIAAGAREREADRLSDRSMQAASRTLSACEEKGVSILTLQDAQYPERLRQMADPPVALYILGKLPPVDESAVIGVIGTRKATPYGIRMAAKLGREIAEGGGIVVSGLADGCDGAAMEAALLAGGTVVGVLGTKITEVYPRKNAGLFEAVRRQGALVSEYGPCTRTFPSDFVARNRIIAGLGLGLVVVEAPLHSGTHTTVGFALEQGRDVFAVPGNADGAAAEGSNALIASGAAAVTSGQAVLAAYEGRYALLRQKTPPFEPTHIKKEIDKPRDIVYIDLTDIPEDEPPEIPEDMPEDQRLVLAAMTRPGLHTDDIVGASGLSAPRALAALTMLQLNGWVRQDAGRRYTRTNKRG